MVKTPVIQCSPCYTTVSALLTNPLPDHSNYSPFLPPPLPHSGSILFGPDPLPFEFRIESGTQEKNSALRKLNNKQSKCRCSLSSSNCLSLFSLYLYPLSAPFLNPLSSPSPPSLLSLLINSYTSLQVSLHSVSPMAHIFAFCFTP